jgi:hypothetical protein
MAITLPKLHHAVGHDRYGRWPSETIMDWSQIVEAVDPDCRADAVRTKKEGYKLRTPRGPFRAVAGLYPSETVCLRSDEFRLTVIPYNDFLKPINSPLI